MSAFDDYYDLFASGDAEKIKCVLAGAGAGAVGGGVSAGLAFAPANVAPGAGQAINATAAAVGAVLGGILGGSAAYKVCGGAETQGNLQRLFTQGKAPVEVISGYEQTLIGQYGISASDARLLSQAAAVYSASPGSRSTENIIASDIEKRNAIALLLAKLKPDSRA